jgi:tetratricopeptide (TPR) repeat protein/SAM-dependent methyltransferase
MNRNQRRAAKKQGAGQPPLAPPRVPALFAEALRLHQSGRVAEAEQLYRQVLALAPGHPDSLHLLGVAAYQAGRLDAAVDLIGQAIARKESVAFYHNNLGLALKDQGKPAAAVARFERALALQPDYLEAHNNLGNALQTLGRFDEAAAHYRQAVTIKPDYAEAHNNLGNVLQELGRTDDAVAAYERTLAIKPDYAEAHNNLGAVLLDLGRPDDARARFERALALRPAYVEAQDNLGVALEKLGRHREAIACHERAIQLQPGYVEAHNNLGVALQEAGEFDRAVGAFEHALQLQPDYAEARKNLGSALHARAADRSGRALSTLGSLGFGGVRGQYESLPFPARDPEAERHILCVAPADTLGKVNQYCFGGARDFARGLRVLVAGCGTGDSVIWLAHQLRDTRAEIVALDLSAASLTIARARAAVRGFDRIQWINASLLDLPRLGLGAFDYITCLGVLHHLPEPEAGLTALESVLAPQGGMALMLYGAQGRAHIYQMQETLRRLADGITDRAARLALARRVLAELPPTNPFRLREGWSNIQQAYLKDDANLWDTLLHEQDRAYRASEVRALLASAGLFVQAFATYKATPAVSALQYDLDLYLGDGAESVRLDAMGPAEREDLAETLDGGLALHTVYAARTPDAALAPAAPHAILSPMSELGQQAIAHLTRQAEAPIPVLLRNGKIVTYRPSALTRAFLGAIDGARSNDEIAHALWGDDAARHYPLIVPELKIPAALHWVIARTSDGSASPILPMPGKFSLPLRHEEPAVLVEQAPASTETPRV